MKKLLFLILPIFSFYSCVTELPILNTVDRTDRFFSIDFTKYSQKDFLITPEKYTGEYESVGIISYEVLPGANYRFSGKKENKYYMRDGSNGPEFIESYEWKVDEINLSEVLDSIYLKCTKLGADAFVNFTVKNATNNIDWPKNPVYIVGVEVSGFAIKRKK